MRHLIALLILAILSPNLRSAFAVCRQEPDSTDLVNRAFAQLSAHHLDSAEALLHPILSGSVKSTREQHAAALVLNGVGQFLRAQDSASRASFNAALALRPDFHGDWLFDIDSTLGHAWQQEQNRALCGDPDAVTIDSTKRETTRPPVLSAKPRLVSMPAVKLPYWAQENGVHGRVLIAAIINPAGRVTRESIHVMRSPKDVLSDEAAWALEQAVFRPGRIGDRAVSVCAILPFDFDIRP